MLYDPIRQKNLVATPEEDVRQHLVHWLLNTCKVPAQMMETEFALSQLQKGNRDRVDLLVHSFRTGGDVRSPWLLAECKRVGEVNWSDLEVQLNKYLRILRPRHVLLGIGYDWRILSQVATGSGYTSVAALPEYPG